MEKNKLFLTVIVVVLLVGSFIYFKDELLFGKRMKTIKLGFLGDYSDEDAGKNALLGTQIAVDEINSDANSNVKIEFVTYNTNGDNSVYEEYYRKLVEEDNVDAIITPNVENMKIAEQFKVPTIFTGQNRLMVDKKDKFYWGAELSYIRSDELFRVIRDLDLKYNFKDAIVITDNTKDTAGFNKLVSIFLPKFNIENLGVLNLNNNLDAIVEEVKKSNPDLIIVLADTDNGIEILRKVKNQNLDPKAFLVAGYKLKIVSLIGYLNVLPSKVYIPLYLTSISRDKPSSRFTDRFALFDRKVADMTNGEITNSITLNAYDSVYLIKDLVSRIKLKEGDVQYNREKIVEGIWATNNYVATRGRLFADGKTGFIRRSFYRMLLLDKGQSIIRRGL